MVYKCKMCGGSLEIAESSKKCTCDFCGTTQTLPSVRDENIQALFNRATVLRMKSEFDKASEIYEKILHANMEEAEAYWGLILCKYGIEYVEDPVTYKRIPTCHRASYDAVVTDDDYKNAIRYADMEQRLIFEEQAKQIDEIQKGIIALAQKEDPYDVFICYKESDENGRRTPDSVIANDIYYQLKQEGYKVFYAAITLEDKLGKEYEPYIFSALNTSKVMLAIGTKPEYFLSVWVKNEWSRFLKIMKKDRSRLLIPCFKDMDAYELPEEFAHLQAQDMSKIGFINDIVRGIKKVIVKETDKPAEKTSAPAQAVVYNANITALLKRGYMALEDGEWEEANGFFEEVLNQDAECAESYLGKYLAEMEVPDMDSLKEKLLAGYAFATSERLYACDEASDRIKASVKEYTLPGYLDESTIKGMYGFDWSFQSETKSWRNLKELLQQKLDKNKNLAKARKYAKEKTKENIEGFFSSIEEVFDERIEAAERSDKTNTEKIAQAYSDFMDKTDERVKKLREQADERKENYFQSLVSQMNRAEDIGDYLTVQKKLQDMSGYSNADELVRKCDTRIEEIKEQKSLAEKERKYQEAAKLKNKATSENDFSKARAAFIAISNYKDARELADECLNEINRIQLERINKENELRRAKEREAKRKARNKKITIISIVSLIIIALAFFIITKIIIPNVQYDKAVKLMAEENYTEAKEIFEQLGELQDSKIKLAACNNNIQYLSAVELMNEKKYGEAADTFKEISGFKDSTEKYNECMYEYATVLMDEKKYSEAAQIFKKIAEYSDSGNKYEECMYEYAEGLMNEKKYDVAAEAFEKINDYDDSETKIKECFYEYALILMNENKYVEAAGSFEKALGYKDSETKKKECHYVHAIELMDSKKFKEAILLFRGILGYKDSSERLFLCKFYDIKNSDVGDTVYLGNYEENTTWIVLEKKEEKVLLISKECIFEKKYNESDSSVTWEDSSLRKWLNYTYFSDAFAEKEMERILSTTIDNKNNSKYGTKGGNSTTDKVFLLSIDETKKYFSTDEKRIAKLSGEEVGWWLRSPGDNIYHVALVANDGSINESGTKPNWARAVRPALWVDISNL